MLRHMEHMVVVEKNTQFRILTPGEGLEEGEPYKAQH